MIFLHRALFIFLLILIGACAYPRPTPVGDSSPFIEDIVFDPSGLREYADDATVYTIGPFDRLQIAIWRFEDLSKEVLVKEDGTIYVPAAGHVPVAGLTLRQAQERLTEAFTRFIKDPQLDLSPVEVRSKRYFIVGAVTQPGGYPLFRSTTIREAVSLAGGTKPDAVPQGAYLRRGNRIYPIDLASMWTQGVEDAWIQAGDTIYVPTQGQSQVYVLGHVTRPGSYPLRNHGLDVIGAIAQAGGFKLGADEDEVGILRRHGEQMIMRVVDVKNAVRYAEGRAQSFGLQPGDVVWVAPSGFGSWNNALEMIEPTLNLLLFRPASFARDYFWIQDLLDR